MGWKDDLNYGLAAFGVKIPDTLPIEAWAARLGDKPTTNMLKIVGIAAGIFFVAEKDHNPKVNSIYDALIYCSTCLSVGYHDVFPKTPIGKLIGTLLMSLGPALAVRTLEGTSDSSQPDVQQQILTTLQSLAAQLQAGSTVEASPRV